MSFYTNSFIHVSVVLALTACQTSSETAAIDASVIGPVAEPLALIEEPVYQVGDEYSYVRRHLNDKVSDGQIVAIAEDGQQTWLSSEQGSGTRIDFANWTKWSNKDAEGYETRTGEQSLFPLTPGKEVKWTYEGVHNGESFRGIRICTVGEQVRVNVPAGEFDTIKVSCRQGKTADYSTRVYYYAPAVQNDVIHIYTTTDGKRNERSELLSYTPAASS